MNKVPKIGINNIGYNEILTNIEAVSALKEVLPNDSVSCHALRTSRKRRKLKFNLVLAPLKATNTIMPKLIRKGINDRAVTHNGPKFNSGNVCPPMCIFTSV